MIEMLRAGARVTSDEKRAGLRKNDIHGVKDLRLAQDDHRRGRVRCESEETAAEAASREGVPSLLSRVLRGRGPMTH